MTDKTVKENLEINAFNYIRLGTLLRKNRSLAKKTEVEKIITSQMTIEEKIEEIEKIDKTLISPTDRFKSLERLPSQEASASASEAKRGKPYQKTEYVKHSVIASTHNRQQLLLHPAPSRFVDYVLQERLKFTEFARTSGLVDPGFLALFPKVDKSGVRKLSDSLQNVLIQKLKPVLAHVLDEGWRHLGKYEYNLIAAFSRLVEEAARANYRYEKKDRSYFSHFSSLERAFLLFYSRPEFISDLRNAAESALSHENLTDKERRQVLASLNLFLLDTAAKPCLHDFILMLSMIMSRRAVSVGDLISKDSGILICTDEFDCSPAIQAAIDLKIADLVKKLNTLAPGNVNADSSIYYIPYDDGDELDLSPVNTLIGQDICALDKRTDAGKLMVSIIEKYMDSYGKYLDVELETFSLRTVRIMNEHALEYELGKLQYARTSLEKMGLPLTHVRFKAIKMGFESPTQFEAAAIGSITEIAVLFWLIGSKISIHMYNLYALRTLSRDDSSPPAAKTVSPLDEILVDDIADGQSMGDRGIGAARAAFAVAGAFMNPDILKIVQTRRQAKDELRQTMKLLERLALSAEYSAIREQFGLLGF
jgi:hypothetical protein